MKKFIITTLIIGITNSIAQTTAFTVSKNLDNNPNPSTKIKYSTPIDATKGNLKTFIYLKILS